jgi:hypothetical protein
MTIPRPAPHASPERRADAAEHGPAPLLLFAVAVAVAVALISPGRGDGQPDDAVSEGIAVAARCDATLDANAATGGTERWADCIDRQLRRLPADPVAVVGLHFHAWRIAERAVAAGAGRARALGDTHLRALSAALDGNLLSLHRLCAAAGADCRPIADRLARQVSRRSRPRATAAGPRT